VYRTGENPTTLAQRSLALEEKVKALQLRNGRLRRLEIAPRLAEGFWNPNLDSL